MFGPPSDACWFINPMNAEVISPISPSETVVINQLSYHKSAINPIYLIFSYGFCSAFLSVFINQQGPTMLSPEDSTPKEVLEAVKAVEAVEAASAGEGFETAPQLWPWP